MNTNQVTINYIDGLRQFGINLLTHEACSYSLRGLYDLSEDGVRVMEAFLGYNLKIEKGTNMNPSFYYQPDAENYIVVSAIASIMLPDGMILPLIKFILWNEVKAYAAYECGYGNYIALTEKQFYELVRDNTDSCLAEDLPEDVRDHILYNYAYNPDPKISVGGRNVHQATGRVR